MTYSFIFPGQGSQFVGMGKDLAAAYPVAREIFEKVNESVRIDLSKIMFEGPENQLNLTENTQPALMAVSMAVIAVLQKQGGIEIENICSYVAGHSLGEYSALTAAGALDLSDTARLLKLRGQYMQQAVPVGVGAMAAILGLDLPDVQAITKEIQGSEICEAGNDNSPGQVVVSGHKAAVEKAVALATERGAKRAVMLPVSAPFHCALMAPAAKKMEEALAAATFTKPIVPVVSNVTAKGESEPDELRRLLVKQITGTVRWRESVLWMKDQGVTHMVEIGAGKVLSGLVRRIDKDIACDCVGTPQQIEDLIKKLKS